MKATVHLSDNSVVSGYLSLNTITANKATIWQPQQRKTVELPLHQLKGYQLEDDFYAFRLIQPNYNKIYITGKPPASWKFVKQLTAAGNGIQLFEYDELVQEEKSTLTRKVKHYFAELPGNNDSVLWDISTQKFKTALENWLNTTAKNCESINQLYLQSYQAAFAGNNTSKRFSFLQLLADAAGRCNK
jgi:hypothetical protein